MKILLELSIIYLFNKLNYKTRFIQKIKLIVYSSSGFASLSAKSVAYITRVIHPNSS